MATLTIQDIPEPLYRKLRERARKDLRSLSQEVVFLLSQAVNRAGFDRRLETAATLFLKDSLRKRPRRISAARADRLADEAKHRTRPARA